MNSSEPKDASSPDLAPLPRLLLAYAPAGERAWQALCWQLDQRLAGIAQRGGDPTIGAIRLAWWDAVLVEGDRAKGGGEPLVERWRALAPDGAEKGAADLIDGWRALVSPEDMSDSDLLAYGAARGGGLFALLAGEGEAQRLAGTLWALWDLAAHVRDEELARRAIAVARQAMPARPPRLDARPVRLALALAWSDIAARRVSSGGFTVRHYGRLLLASLRG